MAATQTDKQNLLDEVNAVHHQLKNMTFAQQNKSNPVLDAQKNLRKASLHAVEQMRTQLNSSTPTTAKITDARETLGALSKWVNNPTNHKVLANVALVAEKESNKTSSTPDEKRSWGSVARIALVAVVIIVIIASIAFQCNFGVPPMSLNSMPSMGLGESSVKPANNMTHAAQELKTALQALELSPEPERLTNDAGKHLKNNSEDTKPPSFNH